MPRALWKGYLRLSLVSCEIALYPATSKAERTRFHRIHRQTGRRLRQQMVEPESLEPVESDDAVRGYEIAPSRPASPLAREERPAAAPRYAEIEEEELKRIEIVNTHTIDIEHFVPRSQIDDRYINAPYYAVPSGEVGQDAYAVIRDAMKERESAALARVVLSRREHAVMIEPFGKGMLAVTLRYPYEVRDQAPYFEGIADLSLPEDMKELALLIVDRKKGSFDPAKIEDRYKKALDELIASKANARVIETVKNEPSGAKVINLMDALRASIGEDAKPRKRRKR